MHLVMKCHSNLEEIKQEYSQSSSFLDAVWEVLANVRMELKELNEINIPIKRRWMIITCRCY